MEACWSMMLYIMSGALFSSPIHRACIASEAITQHFRLQASAHYNLDIFNVLFTRYTVKEVHGSLWEAFPASYALL